MFFLIFGYISTVIINVIIASNKTNSVFFFFLVSLIPIVNHFVFLLLLGSTNEKVLKRLEEAEKKIESYEQIISNLDKTKLDINVSDSTMADFKPKAS